MKTKEQVNKEFDNKYYEVMQGYKNAGFVYDLPKGLKSYISSIRQNDVDELIEWAEGEEKFTPPDRSKSPMFTYKDVTAPYNRGYNSALSDIITHLKSIKEKI